MRPMACMQKVPVCSTIACKVVTEDDEQGGGLFLDATTVQRVLLYRAPANRGGQLPAQLPAFPIKLKGPAGDLLRRRGSTPPWKLVEEHGQRSLKMVSLKLFLKDGPLDAQQHSHS